MLMYLSIHPDGKMTAMIRTMAEDNDGKQIVLYVIEHVKVVILLEDEMTPDLKTITQLWDEFDENRPFSLQVAQHYAGTNVRVLCRDGGLDHTYEGIVKPINDVITEVGEDILLNDCVIRLSAVLE